MFKIGDKVRTKKLLCGSEVLEIGEIVEILEYRFRVKFFNFFWELLESELILV